MKKSMFVFGFAAFLYATFGIASLIRESRLGQYDAIGHAAVFALLIVVAWFFTPARLPQAAARWAALGLSAILTLAGIAFEWAPLILLLLRLGLMAAVAAVLLAVPPADADSGPPAAFGPVLRIFLGLAALLELSIDVRPALALHGLTPPIDWLPSNLIVSGAIAIAFMVAARIPARIPQPRPGQTLIAIGVGGYVLVPLILASTVAPLYERLNASGQALLLYVSSVLLPAAGALIHAVLLIGVYRMLVNLAPQAALVSGDEVRKALGLQTQRLKSGFELLLVLAVAGLLAGFLLIRTLNAVMDQG